MRALLLAVVGAALAACILVLVRTGGPAGPFDPAAMPASTSGLVTVRGTPAPEAGTDFTHRYREGVVNYRLVPFREGGQVVLLVEAASLGGLPTGTADFTGLVGPLAATFFAPDLEGLVPDRSVLALRPGAPGGRRPVAGLGVVALGAVLVAFGRRWFADASNPGLSRGPHRRPLRAVPLPAKLLLLTLVSPAGVVWWALSPGFPTAGGAAAILFTVATSAVGLALGAAFAGDEQGFTFRSGLSAQALSCRVEELRRLELRPSSWHALVGGHSSLTLLVETSSGERATVLLLDELAEAAKAWSARAPRPTVVPLPAPPAPPGGLEGVLARVAPVDQRLQGAQGLIFVWALALPAAWVAIGTIEAGKPSWAPLVRLYRLGGRWGVMALLGAAGVALVVSLLRARRRERQLVGELGPELVLRARLFAQAKLPAWMRTYREDGSLTTATRVSLVFAVLFAAAMLAVAALVP